MKRCKATEMWSSMPSGFTHAEHLEAQSLQQARQVRLKGLETPMEDHRLTFDRDSCSG